MKYEVTNDSCKTDCFYGEENEFMKSIVKIGSQKCRQCRNFINQDYIRKTVSCELELVEKAQLLLKEIE